MIRIITNKGNFIDFPEAKSFEFGNDRTRIRDKNGALKACFVTNNIVGVVELDDSAVPIEIPEYEPWRDAFDAMDCQSR